MSGTRVSVRAGTGRKGAGNATVPGWHVRAGDRFHVFFEHESAARRTAQRRRENPDYEVTMADFEPCTLSDDHNTTDKG